MNDDTNSIDGTPKATAGIPDLSPPTNEPPRNAIPANATWSLMPQPKQSQGVRLYAVPENMDVH